MLAISIGVVVRYWQLFDKLVLPTITLLSPVSPIAWLPVAIFLFGIGNAPAIFMVVVALFFHMVLATINQIDGVSPNLINVARTMGATKRQIYARVIVPAILPGMLAVLRMNLFGAWMVVLIAESTGVGYGMGQVIMLARNTFNPSLVFFTIAVIGVLGFTFDWLLRPGPAAHPLLAARHEGEAAWPLKRSSRSRPRTPWSAAASARPGRPAPSGRTRRCATSISTSSRASSWSSSAPRAAARAPCSISSPASRTPPKARSGRSATGSRRRRPTAA